MSTRLDQSGHAVSAFDGVGALPAVERNEQDLITHSSSGRGYDTFFTYDTQGNPLTAEDELSDSGQFIDISQTGQSLAGMQGVVDASVLIDLPFEFQFYDQPYTQAGINSHGNVSFGGTNRNPSHKPLNAAASSLKNLPSLLPFWMSLVVDNNEGKVASVFTEVLGTPGNRRFVIQWHQVESTNPFFDKGDITFQVILTEGSNDIEFNYRDVHFDGSTEDTIGKGRNATVGIWNSDTQFQQFSYNTASLRNGLSLRLSPEGITRLEGPSPTKQLFTYDPVFNQITSATDELGRQTFYQIDPANGNVLSTALAIGAAGGEDNVVTRYTYTPQGLIDIMTDPLGRVTDYEYDALGRLVTTTFAKGTVEEAVERYEYDNAGNRTATINTKGNRTQSEYDAANRLLKITEADPDGTGPLNTPVTTYAYDLAGNLVKMTDARGNITQYEYDPLNRQTKIIDASNSETRFSYDKVGNLVSVTDPLGRITQSKYDARNRLIETIDPNNGSTKFGYDLDNNCTSVLDPLSNQTQFFYDARNRLVRETDPLGKSMTYEYDLVNHRLAQTDRNGNTTRFEYDELDRLTREIDPSGNSITTIYDKVGNVTALTDSLSRKTQWNYDALNRPTAETDPLNNKTTTTYDKVGNVTTISDALNQTTFYTYDALNRQTVVTDALGKTTTTAYDALGNVVKLTDPLGNTTTFSYDKLNRKTAETNALGKIRSFSYDVVGNLTGTTDRIGRVRRFTYDKLDRQTQEQWLSTTNTAVRTLSFAYDAASQLTQALDPSSTCRYTYDKASRLTTTNNTGTTGVPTVLLNSTYDAVGNRLSLTDTIGAVLRGTTSFTYDALNRLSVVSQSVNGVTNKRVDMAYDAASQVTSLQRYADAAKTQPVASSNYTYDLAGRLTRLTHTKGTTTFANHTWAYDTANRISRFTSPDGSSAYTYDKTHQLTATDHSYQTDEAYTYDANGNRTNTGYRTGTNNQLLADGTYNYVYDLESNRIKRTHISTGEVTEYTWDYRNRLTRVVTKNSTAKIIKTADYTYDVFDRRIAKSVDPDGAGTATAKIERFVYDGDHIVLEFDGSGTQIHRYLHGPAIDQILADENAQGQVLWALTDNQGTVRDLVNSTGTVQNHLKYNSFGRVTSESNSSMDHCFGYTGRELDEEAGLVFYRARYYDPVVGRFISEDPIGFEGEDANLYRYVGNSPTNATDPSGHQLIRPLLPGPITPLPPSLLKLDQCSQKCILVGLVGGAPGVVGVERGQPTIPTRGKPRGATPGTSPASRYLSRKFPKKLRVQIPAPVIPRNLGAKTNVLGRVLGRWVPIVGWGLLGVDAVVVAACLKKCKDKKKTACNCSGSEIAIG